MKSPKVIINAFPSASLEECTHIEIPTTSGEYPARIQPEDIAPGSQYFFIGGDEKIYTKDAVGRSRSVKDKLNNKKKITEFLGGTHHSIKAHYDAAAQHEAKPLLVNIYDWLINSTESLPGKYDAHVFVLPLDGLQALTIWCFANTWSCLDVYVEIGGVDIKEPPTISINNRIIKPFIVTNSKNSADAMSRVSLSALGVDIKQPIVIPLPNFVKQEPEQNQQTATAAWQKTDKKAKQLTGPLLFIVVTFLIGVVAVFGQFTYKEYTANSLLAQQTTLQTIQNQIVAAQKEKIKLSATRTQALARRLNIGVWEKAEELLIDLDQRFELNQFYFKTNNEQLEVKANIIRNDEAFAADAIDISEYVKQSLPKNCYATSSTNLRNQSQRTFLAVNLDIECKVNIK